MGPEFNDKGPCKREAEEGCEAERRKTDAKEKGGSEARVVQPSLGCDMATTNQERLEQEQEPH